MLRLVAYPVHQAQPVPTLASTGVPDLDGLTFRVRGWWGLPDCQHTPAWPPINPASQPNRCRQRRHPIGLSLHLAHREKFT